jgi:hypothetical protein
MRTRSRAIVLFLLVAIGAGAAGIIWHSVTRVRTIESTAEVAASRLDAVVERTARFDAALQAFLGRRDASVAWFTSASDVVADLDARAAELDAALPGIAMTERARLAEALQRARETVDGARANFDAGSTLMALDAVESNGRPAAAALWSELSALRSAFRADAETAQRQWWRRAGSAGGVWALSWAIGLLWLARSRPAPSIPAATPAEPAAEMAAMPTPPAPAAPAPSLADLAEVCERIGRIRDSSEIAPVLARCAGVLHATGLVLWARDGDALVVGAAHGYPDGLARRLGRVALADENLLTRAWHTARPQTAAAADGRRAAVAAPLVGAHGPAGVLAAELMPDVDVETAAGAARLVAGQLGMVLGEAVETVAATAGAQGSAGDTPAATPNALAG